MHLAKQTNIDSQALVKYLNRSSIVMTGWENIVCLNLINEDVRAVETRFKPDQIMFHEQMKTLPSKV